MLQRKKVKKKVQRQQNLNLKISYKTKQPFSNKKKAVVFVSKNKKMGI